MRKSKKKQSSIQPKDKKGRQWATQVWATTRANVGASERCDENATMWTAPEETFHGLVNIPTYGVFCVPLLSFRRVPPKSQKNRPQFCLYTSNVRASRALSVLLAHCKQIPIRVTSLQKSLSESIVENRHVRKQLEYNNDKTTLQLFL